MSDELHRQLDDLTAAMGPAQHKCNETYLAWNLATREWNDLIRRRDAVWSKMLDNITRALPEAQKTL